MNPVVWDDPEGGIVLELPITDGITLTVNMADDDAQEMVDIIQNKLNARE